MAKKKLERFAEVATFSNVFNISYEESLKGFNLKGNWSREFFGNNHPIILELGCGKGDYTIGLAQKFPDKNFIGIDIKGNRIWKGAKTAFENNMHNVAFLRTRIDFIESCFEKEEVSEMWITFPDPQPQKPRERKRLTSQFFLNRYKNVLKKNGLIHLKTDNLPLYNYSLNVIEENKYKLLDATPDLYKENDLANRDEAISIQTFYEKIFLKEGLPITYLKFQLTGIL